MSNCCCTKTPPLPPNCPETETCRDSHLALHSKPPIDERHLYQADCCYGANICGNDCRYERLTCDQQIFTRWRSLYELTTGNTGQELLRDKADCRRKPFLPRRCELCNITDDIYMTEQICKRYIKPVCPQLSCEGDYGKCALPPRYPPPMIMTDPRYCFRHKNVGCFDKCERRDVRQIDELPKPICCTKEPVPQLECCNKEKDMLQENEC